MNSKPYVNTGPAATGARNGPLFGSTAEELLDHLKEIDVRLWVEGGRLRFSAPRGALTASLRDALRRHKPALLERLSQPESAPLSFAQERLWFIEHYFRDRPSAAGAYVMPTVVFLGALDAAAFDAALMDLTARHDNLRTRFVTRDGEPQQRVAEQGSPVWLRIDMTLGEKRAARESQRLVVREARRPFDLETGPLWRAVVMRRGADDHLLLFTMHHIISDGWSMKIVERDLRTAYEARRAGRAPGWSALPMQYADFALWQRERLRGEGLERELAVWRQRLAGAPASLDLPYDRPPGEVTSYAGELRAREIDGALGEGLQRLAREHGASFFMAVAAAMTAWLHRTTGQDDLTAGTPVAGRERAEVEDLIGFFVNTLVLRSQTGPETSLETHLMAMKEVCLEAYANQTVPFERLVMELAPQRRAGQTPLFEVLLLTMANERGPEVAGPQLGPLTFTLHETPERLFAVLTYRRALFDVTTIERRLGHFEQLLSTALAEPARPLAALPLLAPAEAHQLLHEWNDTRAPRPWDGGIHLEIARRAAAAPAAPALVTQDERWSYGELEAYAGALAARLRTAGAGPEKVVALCAARSLKSVAALYAVLRSGAGFLPLDPSSPPERLAFQLADAGACAVLVDDTGAAALDSEAPTPVHLDSNHGHLDSIHGERETARPADPRQLAYVIYTSGSTGRPKGVMIPHRALSNIVHSFNASYGLDPADRVLQHTALTFDVAVNEIFPTLVAGAALVLAPPGAEIDFPRLRDLVKREQVTVLGSAPSVLARWDELAEDLGLRLVLSGGEALARHDVERLMKRATVVNGYGPTEATIAALAEPLGRSGPASPPLGRPLANYRVRIHDRRGRLLGIGGSGEAWIGGRGLARGYLGQPGKTAAVFVPDPAGHGERLYRTGDRMRQLADGRFVFLGRVDSQLKLRGQRIEPGEIEARLAEIDGVREAAVVLPETGERRLVAYVSAAPGCDTADLPNVLRGRLPAHMVPSAFIELDRLPLTPHGKIDRRELARRESPRETDHAEPPRSAAERRLAAIWSRHLGVEEISRHDDFFALGGHSLLAVQLIGEAEEEFGRHLPLSVLFEAPTLAALAARLSGEPGTASGPLVALREEGERPPLFFVHPIGGSVLAFRELAERLHPEQPFYALEAPETGDFSVCELAALYLDAVRRVQPVGPFRLGGFSFGGTIAFEMARQLTTDGERTALLILVDAAAPFGPRTREVSSEEIESQARAAGLLPGKPGRDRRDRLLRGTQARLAAFSAYRPAGIHEGCTLLLRARRPAGRPDPLAGWSALLRCREEYQIDALHDELLREPAVDRVAEILERALGDPRY